MFHNVPPERDKYFYGNDYTRFAPRAQQCRAFQRKKTGRTQKARPKQKQCGGRLCSRPPQRDPIFRDAKVLLFWCDQQQKEYWFY
ncbi:hypothetical protein, partial [Faecalibacterium sp. An121]|uniref:hypothetical protein n=1 Tax=Faecalibacterium sp. An121 TaxID=1965550 RepID=UPI0019CF9D04